MTPITTIARADARRAVTSRLLWGSIALLGLLFLPSTGASARPDVHSIGEFLLLVPLELMTFSLIVVAAVGSNAVVGERVAGTVRVILGAPATRRDFVVGTLLSRMGIVAVALAVVLAIANALILRGYGRPYLLPFWVMGAWMLCYVVVWSAVTIGYSAAFDSPYRTLTALVVTYLVFSLDFGVWPVVIRPAFAFLFTGSFTPPAYDTLAAAPLWLRVVERLNPLVDFWQALRWSIAAAGPGQPTGGPLPHVLGAVVFVAFGAVPFVAGLRRFERADLGDEASGSPVLARLRQRLGPLRPVRNFSGFPPATATPAGRIRSLALADIRHALRNRVVSGGVLVAVLLVGPVLWARVDPSGIATTRDVLTDIPLAFSLPVVIVGIAVGHNAIVGERTAGTVGLVLGMPVTRRDLVVSTLLSRLGIVVGIFVPLLVFAETLVVSRLGGLHLPAALAWAGWVLLFAVFWTSVAVGVSAAVTSRYRSLAAIGGVFLLFNRTVGLWEPVVRPTIALLATGDASAPDQFRLDDVPAWAQYLDHLNPFVALSTLRDGLFELTGYGTEYTAFALPLFVYSFGIVVGGAAAALALGTRRVERADLP